MRWPRGGRAVRMLRSDRIDVPGRSTLGRGLAAHRGEWLLGALLLVELIVFAGVAVNFVSVENAGEIARASTEVGLLALALTPVVLTGGIDLSVGSLLGLSAVVFGAASRAAGMSVPLAIVIAMTVALAGGALNAVLVARLRVPALIVTLGTYSLFRGVAEGLTGGITNYSNFPWAFLELGQGRFVGVPVQLLVFVVAAFGFWLLVHRTAIGRTLRAIGFSNDGATYAGIPVTRRLALVYLLSGATAGVASLVYVARLGQAKADAGTGFELMAITAVVLGGTSIFGGRGSVVGTLLGVAILAVLQNGLRLADLPAELAGVLAGVLLVTAIAANRLVSSNAGVR
jgi:ribose/xylose/arabinose/galactoside ABC-type transport system permease subunit